MLAINRLIIDDLAMDRLCLLALPPPLIPPPPPPLLLLVQHKEMHPSLVPQRLAEILTTVGNDVFCKCTPIHAGVYAAF